MSHISQIFWRKVREEMRMEILLEKKPMKQFKLYELTEDEMNIQLDEVTLWSTDNQKIYTEIKENGFADFICNKEYLLETYSQLIFDSEDVEVMDNQLLFFKNLQFLRLNHNKIKIVQHLPPTLIELHVFNNPIIGFNLIKHNLQYLGIGYCQLTDEAIRMLPTHLHCLLALDLTHNQLVDIEETLDICSKFTSLKVLCLYGNPLTLMPQYFNCVVDQLINLKYFDEQKLIDIKNRLLQAENERLARIQESARKAQELYEQQQKAIADKNKKGAKPPPQQQQQQQQQVVVPPPQPIDEPQIDLSKLTQFKITIKLQTLENVEGVILERVNELQPERLFMSKFSGIIDFVDEQIEVPEILFDKATLEGEQQLGRLDLNFSYEQKYTPSVEIRDFFEKGIIIKIFIEEPKLTISEEGEKKPILIDELPEQEKRLLGLCLVRPDWLRGDNKKLQKKYRLFPKECAELIYPLDNEQKKVQERMEFIKEQIAKEEEAKQKALLEIQQKKDAVKGGKQVKKKDDKKNAKKGKEEPIVVGILPYDMDDRQYVYVNDTTILRASQVALAIDLELGY